MEYVLIFKELLTQRIILTAGTDVLPIADIPFTVATSNQSEVSTQQQLDIYLNIDPTGIEFIKMEDRYIYDLQITVFFADKKNKILGNDWKTLQKELSEEDYNRVMKEGVLYKTTIPVEVENQKFKVVVYDEVGNKLGSSLFKSMDISPATE